MVEHNNSNYDNVYKFNGKELDEQTGFYYYGARYYDPVTSIFLSVDPLAEDFPSFTPYHYVHNNPINLIDPTGMAAVPPTEGEFANGYVHTDSDGSWTYNDGVWGDNSGGGKDILEGINFTVQGSDSSKMASLIADFTGGSQAVQTHLEAQKLSANSDGSTDWRGYAAYTLMQEKANNPGGLEIGRNLFGRSPATTKVGAEVAVHGNSLKSMRPTWGYKLYSQDGTFLKNGITSQAKAESRYTKAYMSDKYMEKQMFPNRRAAYDWEAAQNKIQKGPLNKNNH